MFSALSKYFRVGTVGGNPQYSAPVSTFRTRPPTPPFYAGVPGVKMSAGIGTDIYNSQFIKKLTLDLGTPRTVQQFNLSGTILWLYRVYNTADGTPNTSAFLQMRIADYNADDLTWYAGNGLEGIPYNRIFISNPAQAGIACEIAYFSDTAQKPVRFF